MTATAEPTLSPEDIETIAAESARLLQAHNALEQKCAAQAEEIVQLTKKVEEADKAAAEAKKAAQESAKQEKVLLEKVAHHDPEAPQRELVLSMVDQLHDAGVIRSDTREKLAKEVKSAAEGPKGIFDKILSTVVDSLNEAPSNGHGFQKRANSIETGRPADPHGDWEWLTKRYGK